MMNKTARELADFYTGKACGFQKLGFSQEAVIDILAKEGLSKEAADHLVKIAFLGQAAALAGKGLGRLAGMGGSLAGGGAKMLRGALPSAGNAASLGQRAQQSIGRMGIRAGSKIEQLASMPGRQMLPALGRGAVEAGKGALFFGGKGLGGTIGKGIGGYQLASNLGSMVSTGEGPRLPSPYGQYQG